MRLSKTTMTGVNDHKYTAYKNACILVNLHKTNWRSDYYTAREYHKIRTEVYCNEYGLASAIIINPEMFVSDDGSATVDKAIAQFAKLYSHVIKEMMSFFAESMGLKISRDKLANLYGIL